MSSLAMRMTYRLATVAVAIAATSGAARADGFTLEMAVAGARAANERAGMDARTIDAAAARVEQARALFLPSLTLVGTYTRRATESVRDVSGTQVTIQALDALQGQATLNLNLFDPRTIPLYRQALAERDAVRAQSDNDLRLLGFDVANAYLQTLGAAQVFAAARRRLELAQSDLQVARARFQAELARKNDVTRAELEVANADRAATLAQGDVTTAELQLGYLIGQPITGALVEPDELLRAAAAPLSAAAVLAVEARRRRLDITAARHHAAAVRQGALEPLLRYLPSFALAGNLRATNEAGLSGRSTDWSIAIVATWRLFDGGQGLGERKERSALADVAELQADALSRRIDSDVAQAHVALANGQSAVQTAGLALDFARTNMIESTELYRQGLATALEVQAAAASLFDAEVAAIRARYTLAIAFLGLRAVLGLDALGAEPRL